MIDPATAYMANLGIGRPDRPTRKRVIRVKPLLFLAPKCWLIGGLTLEPAVAYYQHLVASAGEFDGAIELLTGKGTCCGFSKVEPIHITAPQVTKREPRPEKPSDLLCDALRSRFQHALLGSYRGQAHAWRAKMGLLPKDYTVTQRLFIPWRYDITGERMEAMIDALGALGHRRFRTSPNSCHRHAVWGHGVTVGFDRYGYSATLWYGYKNDSSAWDVEVLSIKGETFAEFVERATRRLEELLTAAKHPRDWHERSRLEKAEWRAHTRKRPAAAPAQAAGPGDT